MFDKIIYSFNYPPRYVSKRKNSCIYQNIKSSEYLGYFVVNVFINTGSHIATLEGYVI